MTHLRARNLLDLIGHTPLLHIPSLSHLTGCDILLKCEFMNPGGSIKDRAALAMVQEAVELGQLKTGMSIVEGTAGNTGIGLAIVAKAMGFKMRVVMPRGQAPEKERLIELYGATLQLVDACPFKDPRHFYHTAHRIAAEDPEEYWWANQFENLANYRTHLSHTGPEIYQQTEGKLDALIASAGTGGTIAGCSEALKAKLPSLKVVLADPQGSGLYSYLKTGEFKSEGSSMTEGIGIMRLVANFAKAQIDEAIKVSDQELLTVANYVRDQDGLVLGSSSALNVAATVQTALKLGKGKRLVTFACDLGERSYSKLYNPVYLQEQGLVEESMEKLFELYKQRASV